MRRALFWPMTAIWCWACGPSAADELAGASTQVTLESAARLGPHRLEATIVNVEGSRETRETLELLWGDWDNFQARRLRDGRQRAEVRVIQRVAYARAGQGRFTRHEDAELYRTELGYSWNVWDQALGPFVGRIVWEVEDDDAVVEGRPATRYSLSLAEPAEGEEARPRADVPLSLSGEVVLDEATATRLSVEVEGRYLAGGEDERGVKLKLMRSGLGQPPAIETPADARGDRAR